MSDRAEGFWWVRLWSDAATGPEWSMAFVTASGRAFLMLEPEMYDSLEDLEREPSFEWGPYLGKEPGYAPGVADLVRRMDGRGLEGLAENTEDPIRFGTDRNTAAGETIALDRPVPNDGRAVSLPFLPTQHGPHTDEELAAFDAEYNANQERHRAARGVKRRETP